VVWFLVTTLGAFLLVSWRLEIRKADGILALCAALYLHLLMVYEGAHYNARYYLPLLPFFAPYWVRALGSMKWRPARGAILAIHAAGIAALVLFFNVRAIHVAARPLLPAAWFRDYGYFDSYRMRSHL